MHLFWVIFCIVVILGLAYWFTRTLAGKGGSKLFGTGGMGGGMEITQIKTVGRDQKIAVMRVGTRYFLLGITNNNINLLSELSEEDVICQDNLPQETTADPLGFRGLFDALRKTKDQEMNGDDRRSD